MDEEAEARKEFLSQREKVLEDSRRDKGGEGEVSPFEAFANFDGGEDAENLQKAGVNGSFEGPSDVTDATDLFFEAIVSNPPRCYFFQVKVLQLALQKDKW